MKTLKSILFSLLAMIAVAIFLTSCSKEEVDIPQDVVTTTETLTYKLSVPEGTTAETVAEWFNQLSEEEIEEYLTEDIDIITSRSCSSWIGLTNWDIYFSGLSCFSRSCPNSQSQRTIKKSRLAYRICSWGTEYQYQDVTTIWCGPPC